MTRFDEHEIRVVGKGNMIAFNCHRKIYFGINNARETQSYAL